MNKHNDKNTQAINDCLKHFPNITNLILENIFSKESNSFSNNLKSLI